MSAFFLGCFTGALLTCFVALGVNAYLSVRRRQEVADPPAEPDELALLRHGLAVQEEQRRYYLSVGTTLLAKNAEQRAADLRRQIAALEGITP